MFQFKLIGYPIKHSLSPWIHQQFLEEANLDGEYQLFEINPEEDFAERIHLLKQEKLAGFNVTAPFKQTIIPYLDRLDATAKEIEAVNTVVNKDGKWIGYNTDGIGYLRSLESTYPDFFQDLNNSILIIGAGGAARAIYHALTDRGFTSIDIANRTSERAKEIAKLGKANGKTTIYSIEEANQSLQHYDLIIQTTLVGMKDITLKPILMIEDLKPNAIVSDIIYQPIKTQVLQAAETQQARLLFGHTMLLYQAQYAFEIWTNKRVDVTNMEHKLLAILEGR